MHYREAQSGTAGEYVTVDWEKTHVLWNAMGVAKVNVVSEDQETAMLPGTRLVKYMNRHDLSVFRKLYV